MNIRRWRSHHHVASRHHGNKIVKFFRDLLNKNHPSNQDRPPLLSWWFREDVKNRHPNWSVSKGSNRLLLRQTERNSGRKIAPLNGHKPPVVVIVKKESRRFEEIDKNWVMGFVRMVLLLLLLVQSGGWSSDGAWSGFIEEGKERERETRI